MTWIYGRDCAGLVLYDVTANAQGWMLDTRGRVWGVGGADSATGFKPTLSSPIWSGLAIIDDGGGSDPLRLAAVNRSGTLQEWVSSTAPTVTVSEPADPTTDTTRPYVGWTFSDEQGDGQQSWVIKVFDSATGKLLQTLPVRAQQTADSNKGPANPYLRAEVRDFLANLDPVPAHP